MIANIIKHGASHCMTKGRQEWCAWLVARSHWDGVGWDQGSRKEKLASEKRDTLLVIGLWTSNGMGMGDDIFLEMRSNNFSLSNKRTNATESSRSVVLLDRFMISMYDWYTVFSVLVVIVIYLSFSQKCHWSTDFIITMKSLIWFVFCYLLRAKMFEIPPWLFSHSPHFPFL